MKHCRCSESAVVRMKVQCKRTEHAVYLRVLCPDIAVNVQLATDLSTTALAGRRCLAFISSRPVRAFAWQTSGCCGQVGASGGRRVGNPKGLSIRCPWLVPTVARLRHVHSMGEMVAVEPPSVGSGLFGRGGPPRMAGRGEKRYRSAGGSRWRARR